MSALDGILFNTEDIKTLDRVLKYAYERAGEAADPASPETQRDILHAVMLLDGWKDDRRRHQLSLDGETLDISATSMQEALAIGRLLRPDETTTVDR